MAQETVNIHGEEYRVVASRLKQFQEERPHWTIDTNVTYPNENLVLVRAQIIDDRGEIKAVGHAEEDRRMGNINQSSAVENAETSAVGRALAFLDHNYAGGFIRSAEEMSNATLQQELRKEWKYFTKSHGSRPKMPRISGSHQSRFG